MWQNYVEAGSVTSITFPKVPCLVQYRIKMWIVITVEIASNHSILFNKCVIF